MPHSFLSTPLAFGLVGLTILFGASPASAYIDRDVAYGSPCVFQIDQNLMTQFQKDHDCPPMYYCFWDQLPFRYNETTNTKTYYTAAELRNESALDTTYERNSGASPETEMVDGVVSPFGYCDCNKFYAFDRPLESCLHPTAGTYFFNIWAHVLVIMWFYLLAATCYTIYGFQKSQQWKWCSNASCQTLMHICWMAPIMAAFEGGYAATMNFIDTEMVFHRLILSLAFSIGMMGYGKSLMPPLLFHVHPLYNIGQLLSYLTDLLTNFITNIARAHTGICALNIAVAWIEVVEKSQKKGQSGNTALYKRIIYGIIATYSTLIVVTLVILGSTAMAGAVVLLALLVIAVVYRFAGNKLGTMLESGADKKNGELTMDVMVKKTAKEISLLCGIMFFLVVLFVQTTNANVWLSTVGIQGGLTCAWLSCMYVLRFIRFGGRRAMIKAGLKPIFACEMVKAGKLDVKSESSAGSTVEADETTTQGSGNKVAPA
jgi:hypothetical protein